MHAFLHKSRRENHRRVVFTQQDTIYSRAHLVLTNLLITSLLVLCFSQWFLLFLPPKILLISCRPIDSYSDICYLGTDELIIFVSFLWMIWVDLPFLIYLSIYASRRFPGSFSLIISLNSGFSFCYVSSMAFFLKRHFRRHACISTQK